QIKPGLVAALQVSFEFQPVEIHENRGWKLARQQSVRFQQAFKFPGRHIATFNNRAWGEEILQGINDARFTLIHSQRRNLNDQQILILIHYQTAECIAFSVYDAKGGSLWQMALPDLNCGPETLFKKFLAHLHPFRGENSDVNSRF